MMTFIDLLYWICQSLHTIPLGQIAQRALKDALVRGLSRLSIGLFKRDFFMSVLDSYGFPKGPGERSKEHSQLRKCSVTELPEQGNNGGCSRAPQSGKVSTGYS